MAHELLRQGQTNYSREYNRCRDRRPVQTCVERVDDAAEGLYGSSSEPFGQMVQWPCEHGADRADGAAVGRIDDGLGSRCAMVDAVALRQAPGPKQSNTSEEGGVREFREHPLHALDVTAST